MRKRSLVAGLVLLLATAGVAVVGGCMGDYEGFGWNSQPTSPEPRDPSAPVPNGTLTDEQKEKLLDSVTDLVRERAYATGVDFAKWPDHLKKHQAAIDRATNMTQFSNAVNRALNEFGISHIDLMSPRQAQMQHAPRFGGIGITAEAVETGIRVTSVRDNEPASKAGIKTGDVITEVDGQRAELGSIRGLVGTPVKLKVVRSEDGKVSELTVKRAEISIAQPPRLTKVSDDVAMVTIDSFTDEYDRDIVKKVMKEASAYPNLIIDLRYNGGGAVVNFIHFLSTILPKGTEVGTFIDRRMARQFENSDDNKGETPDAVKVAAWSDRKVKINRNPVDPYTGNIAVLINRASASASEIVAAAVRELHEGILVGEHSAGAVLMSTYVKMDNGFEMKVPTSDYVTIKGMRIEGSPLQPDVKARAWNRIRPVDPKDDEVVQAAVSALRAAGSHAETVPAAGDGK
ncbi:MAG: S41 family peptidase [Phycisphaerales bacterium]